MMDRKIVSIAVGHFPEGVKLYAVADDGTAWVAEAKAAVAQVRWSRLPDLPPSTS